MGDDRWQRSPRYYGFLPPQPPQPSRRYFAGIPVTFIMAGLVVVGIVGFSVGILLGLAIAAGNSNTVHVGGSPAVLAPTSTPSPAPSPTPPPKGPYLISGAYIGGTEQAFEDKYGQPTLQYGIPKFPASTSDGASALIGLYDLMAGTDGHQRVVLMTVEPSNDAGATHTGIERLLTLIMPPDAKHVRDLTDPNVGVLHIYQSGDLARSLPASAFADSNGGPPWPAGTFTVNCSDTTNACTIATGV